MVEQKIPSKPYFEGLTPEEVREATHAPLDWEALMEEEVAPSLALGAERRLRR